MKYDGSGFYGFQKQSNHPSVQQTLEGCLKAVSGQSIKIIGAGRTDAGVHALGQVVNFQLAEGIPVRRLAGALNRILPASVRVISSDVVDDDFHSRYSAVSRLYEYRFRSVKEIDPFRARYLLQIRQNLDLALMESAASLFLGSHDFRAFGTPEKGKSPRRDIYRVAVDKKRGYSVVSIEGNAFLRHMARGMVGALIEVGQGMRTVDSIRNALDSPGGQPEFSMAPPNGLYLVRVNY